MKHKIFIILTLVLTACSATTEKYFSGDSIPATLIEPPFASNSKEQKSEVRTVIRMQKRFSLKELELASYEKKLRPEIFILYADRSLTRESYPHLYHLFDRISATSKSSTDHAKKYWNVTRPYIADKRINMLITPSNGPCYPSGHTSGSLMDAHIIGLLIPEKRDALLKLARNIAKRRVLVGMHYPHDLVGGEQLSRLVVGGLMQNKEFQKDFERAKQELTDKPLKKFKDENFKKIKKED